jgi:UDP-N-acetylglucosamine 1-carboxyvinyltransferase
MAAARARGTTVIMNAACEPHVQTLPPALQDGRRHRGDRLERARDRGRRRAARLHHRVGPDHIEVASFIGLAAVTGGDLLIEDAAVEHLRAIRHSFRRLGVEIESRAPACACLRPELWWSTTSRQMPKIEDGPWPMFPPT